MIHDEYTRTMRIVLPNIHTGEFVHLDVTVDFYQVARAQMNRAMRNKSKRSVVAGGAVCVEFVP